jgi:hypothetical protein
MVDAVLVVVVLLQGKKIVFWWLEKKIADAKSTRRKRLLIQQPCYSTSLFKRFLFFRKNKKTRDALHACEYFKWKIFKTQKVD